MTTTAALISRIRLELGDDAKPFAKAFVGDGITTVFSMGFYPVSTLVVSVSSAAGWNTGNWNDGNWNDTTTTTGFTVDGNTGVLTFITPPIIGSAINITGSHYKWFTDANLTSFIETATAQQLYGQVTSTGSQTTLSNMAVVHEYPLSILATIEALWALATDAAFDIDIHTPEGVSIPRSQRYHQLLMLIDEKKSQYKELSALLGIGLYAVGVYNLRKVAMKTGRLVPLYLPREFEDSTPPVRIYTPISTYGGAIKIEQNAIYDIYTVQDTTWNISMDFPFDLSDVTLSAQVRLYAGSPTILAQISITITNTTLGVATLSMTRAQTKDLPERAFWDLKAVGISDPTWSDVYVKGAVYCERQLTTLS